MSDLSTELQATAAIDQAWADSIAGPSTPEDVTDQNRLSQALHIAKVAFQGAVVSAEILPITNEASRFGALAATEVFTHNPLIGAVVLGGSTLAVEGSAALATASLITGETSSKLIGWLDKNLRRVVPKGAKLNPLVTGGLAMTVGVPTLMTAQQIENPGRSTQEARRQGLITSAWMTGVFAVEGALISQGVGHYTDPKYVGPALLTTAALGSIPSWVKRHFKGSAVGNEYQKLVSNATPGPQIEGLSVEEFEQALQDPRTETIAVEGSSEEALKVPLFVPLEYASWMNKAFFAAKGYDADNLLYCALPQGTLAAIKATDLQAKIEEVIVKRGATNIVFDYLEGHDFLSTAVSQPHTVDILETSVENGAATYHYHTHCSPKEEALQQFTANPSVRDISSKEELAEHFPRIWEIYSQRFSDLVDDHPIMGALSEIDLRTTLEAPGSVLKAYFDKTGTLQSFGYIVEDLSLCPWLNQEYVEGQAIDGSKMLYFPGIATAKGYTAPISVPIMKSFLSDMLHKYPDFDLTFECSNISAKYIPRLVELAFKLSGIVNHTPFQEQKYYYNVLKLEAQPTI